MELFFFAAAFWNRDNTRTRFSSQSLKLCLLQEGRKKEMAKKVRVSCLVVTNSLWVGPSALLEMQIIIRDPKIHRSILRDAGTAPSTHLKPGETSTVPGSLCKYQNSEIKSWFGLA